MNIIYSSDENYIRHCACSIYSLLDNNKDVDKINIYLINNNIKDESIKKIKKIINKFNRNLIILDINELCSDFENKTSFPLSAFARLFIQKINVDKILYIDCDTIINDSLKELYATNIDKYMMGAVADTIQKFSMKDINLSENDYYLNSGVLLINLKKWRECNIKEKFLKFLNDYNGEVPHFDQGILNGILNKETLYLDPKYNVMPEMFYLSSKKIKKLYKIKNYYDDEKINDAINNPIIIHYLTKFYNRPWCIDCSHPLKERYIYYLSKTGFNIELEKKDLPKKIKFQKYVLNNFPFGVFVFMERILDLRRYFINHK